MTPERHQRIGELFHVALGLAERERAAFLDRACEGDSELRREVESLVGAHQAFGSVIDRPALEVAAELLADGDGEVVGRMVAGRYRVLSLLGAGGMGDVYLAEDAQLRRKVALKLLSPGFVGDTEPRARFLREARLASALDHPNVCTVHEVGEDGGRLFIAMQYVEGETLRARLQRGRLREGDALDIAAQVASALASAHEAGIVHRDIKPENIMIRRDRLVKVLDFGLAKLTKNKSEPRDGESKARTLELKTSPGMVLGTVAYMSPEQARGLEVDHRTDIFSFGAVLYEMLTGKQGFGAASVAETMSAILNDEPEGLRRPDDMLPPQLVRIVRHCLEKQPEQRFQSASDLKVALEALSLTPAPPHSPL